MKKYLILLFVLAVIHINPVAAATSAPKADSVYICVSTASHKYHSHMCRGLARCTHEIKRVTKAQAIRWGYTPCKICY